VLHRGARKGYGTFSTFDLNLEVTTLAKAAKKKAKKAKKGAKKAKRK
jgi:hypothetical protein